MIIAGIIQGATEFLPVSSSGHLVLFQHFNGGFSHEDLLLDIMLHLGTLAAVATFCRAEVAMLFRAFFRIWRRPRAEQEVRENRLFWAIVIATIPTAAIGFAVRSFLVPLFDNLFLLAFTFGFTTLLLMAGSRARGTRLEISPAGAFLVGVMQGLAVLPGVSRSGSTIVMSQAVGLQRENAARFAFVLAIPAILGASVVSFTDLANLSNFNTGLMFSLFCGMMAAAVVGYLSLVVLTTIIRKAKLHWFAFYTGAVSIFCLISALAG